MALRLSQRCARISSCYLTPPPYSTARRQHRYAQHSAISTGAARGSAINAIVPTPRAVIACHCLYARATRYSLAAAHRVYRCWQTRVTDTIANRLTRRQNTLRQAA